MGRIMLCLLEAFDINSTRTKGQVFTMGRIDEVANALCAIWGGTHPLASAEQFCLKQ